MVKIWRDNDMKKVVFFFGAGAEGTGNFNIRTGYDYLKSSLYASDALFGFNKALASFFEGKNIITINLCIERTHWMCLVLF